MSKGTTEPGFLNPNGQLVIKKADPPRRGTDHLQWVYILECQHCHQRYGANGSDNHHRKCPACQGGRPGI